MGAIGVVVNGLGDEDRNRQRLDWIRTNFSVDE